MSTAISVGQRPRTKRQTLARPTSVSVALTIAEVAGLGATGGDQWLIRNRPPVVPPRLGWQLAGQLAGSVSRSGVAQL